MDQRLSSSSRAPLALETFLHAHHGVIYREDVGALIGQAAMLWQLGELPETQAVWRDAVAIALSAEATRDAPKPARRSSSIAQGASFPLSL